MVQSTARVMALLEILQSGGTRTVAELATRLEVDKRTVRRYVEHLRELDIPVDSVRGRYGGYRLARHFRMPPLMLTDEEALAVVWALLATRASGSGPASPTVVEAALGKLRRVLPSALTARIDAVLDTTEFTTDVHASTATGADEEQDAARLVLELSEAARDLRAVTFDYTTGRGERARREVHPHGVVAHEGRLYLAAHDVVRAAARTFRLDRMENLARTGGTFDPPMTPQSTVRRVTGPLPPDPTRHDVSVLVQAAPAVVRQFFPELLASVDPVTASDVDDTWVRVAVRAERLDWVAQRLAAVDRPFHVERPAELRGVLEGLAHRLLDAASTFTAGPVPPAGRADARVTPERPLPIHTVADALRATVTQRGWSVHELTASRAWAAVVDFASVPVDIPSEPDADGLLYQFGMHDFSGQPAFHFHPVRQLAVHDDDEYVQVGIDVRFAPTPALAALGSHGEWWFSGADTSLDDWAAVVSRRPEWGLLERLVPIAVEIRQDET